MWVSSFSLQWVTGNMFCKNRSLGNEVHTAEMSSNMRKGTFSRADSKGVQGEGCHGKFWINLINLGHFSLHFSSTSPFYYLWMCVKLLVCVAPDQTPHLRHLIWVYTAQACLSKPPQKSLWIRPCFWCAPNASQQSDQSSVSAWRLCNCTGWSESSQGPHVQR